MNGLFRLAICILATEGLFRASGLTSWAVAQSHNWPWLIERYQLIFPPLLFISLIAARSWTAVRSNPLIAISSGLVVGFATGILSLVLGQLLWSEHREIFLQTLNREGGIEVTIVGGAVVVFFLNLSWLYGGLAISMAYSIDYLWPLKDLKPNENQNIL